jgi:hypothetical protein
MRLKIFSAYRGRTSFPQRRKLNRKLRRPIPLCSWDRQAFRHQGILALLRRGTGLAGTVQLRLVQHCYAGIEKHSLDKPESTLPLSSLPVFPGWMRDVLKRAAIRPLLRREDTTEGS